MISKPFGIILLQVDLAYHFGLHRNSHKSLIQAWPVSVSSILTNIIVDTFHILRLLQISCIPTLRDTVI